MCQRVKNFPHPLVISQSHGALSKFWVKLTCMFVEVFLTLVHEGEEMHEGVEFLTLQRGWNSTPFEG